MEDMAQPFSTARMMCKSASYLYVCHFEVDGTLLCALSMSPFLVPDTAFTPDGNTKRQIMGTTREKFHASNEFNTSIGCDEASDESECRCRCPQSEVQIPNSKASPSPNRAPDTAHSPPPNASRFIPPMTRPSNNSIN